MKHFIRKKNKYLKTIPREPLPPRVMTLAESREFFPDNPHTWLCDGKLLRLLDPEDSTNCDLFQVNSNPISTCLNLIKHSHFKYYKQIQYILV